LRHSELGAVDLTEPGKERNRSIQRCFVFNSLVKQQAALLQKKSVFALCICGSAIKRTRASIARQVVDLEPNAIDFSCISQL
jgi:hypothetical protein